jgi:hypothetical protein
MNEYARYTIGFIVPHKNGAAGATGGGAVVLGSVAVEMTAAQVADEQFLQDQLLDQLRRRGPSPASGAIARIFAGDLSDAQICIALRGSGFGVQGSAQEAP